MATKRKMTRRRQSLATAIEEDGTAGRVAQLLEVVDRTRTQIAAQIGEEVIEAYLTWKIARDEEEED